MNAYYSKNTTPANNQIKFTVKHKQSQNMTDDSAGFCICPKCFHLVFDETLTGICPCCHYQFCPSV